MSMQLAIKKIALTIAAGAVLSFAGLAVEAASANQIGSPVDQILLYCFHYDPNEGKYGLVIMNLVRLGGVLTLLAIGCLFVFLWRSDKRRSRRLVSTTG